jgi:hypothetical protein
MIRQLFSTAELLVPGLAYGGNPSADLSVQVVPSPTRACSLSGPAADAREAPLARMSRDSGGDWGSSRGSSDPQQERAPGRPSGNLEHGRKDPISDDGRRHLVLECAWMETILDSSQCTDGGHSSVTTALQDVYFGLLELSS